MLLQLCALVRLTRGSHYQDRADAGRCLACFTDVAGVREVLLELLLDSADTFVTSATTEARLRRGDTAGLAIVCAGVSLAQNQQLDYIHGALHSVLGVFERDRDTALMTCRGLLNDPAQDADVRSGAEQFVAALTDLQPMITNAEKPWPLE